MIAKLTVVLRQKIGSDNTHYVHNPRGIASQHDGAGWSDAIADGLGSVRGWIDSAQAFGDIMDYNPYGVPDSAVDGFGFTGEMMDDNGLMYLRARYYDPNIGTFTALDPFEGVNSRPMSINGYSWVEGNVANWTDASGMSPLLANIFNGQICMQQTSDGISDLCLQECNHLTGFGYAVCLGLCETCQDYWRVSPEDCSVFSFVRHANPNPSSNLLIIHTFADWEYPLSCDQFSDAETCMIYHMVFLSGTNTINELRSRNGYLSPDDYVRFASFVAPDSLWRNLHPLGTPADIKEHYTRYENNTDQGTCISLYGMPYGRDVPGNIIYGYIGRLAGIPSWILVSGAGGAQALDDFRTGNQTSSVNLWNDFGDSPEDTEAVLAGIVLYETCGDLCTMEDIRLVLRVLRSDYVNASQIGNRAECRPTS